jgi:hypothetical protein
MSTAKAALKGRVDALDLDRITGQLDARGFAVTERLLEPGECDDLADANEWSRRPTHHRPNLGKNGHHRVGLRHGCSTLTSGSRTALGIIFHDAR